MALTFISTDSIFLDPNQYNSLDSFSLGMIPTVGPLEAYCDYGGLAEFSFTPYVATTSGPVTGSHHSHSASPIERMKPGSSLLFSTSGDFPLRESLATNVQHAARNNTSQPASKEERHDLARQRRRTRNQMAA